MMQAVNATYDGKNFILDEDVNLTAGQKAIVTILDDEAEITPRVKSDDEIRALIKRFSGSGGKITKGGDAIDKYLANLRKEKNINLRDYMGVGEKMFATSNDVDKYVRDLRDNDRL